MCVDQTHDMANFIASISFTAANERIGRRQFMVSAHDEIHAAAEAHRIADIHVATIGGYDADVLEIRAAG